MSKVTLVNYGLGNIQAFVHIYRRLNIQVEVAATRAQMVGAEKLILPGVGAFDWAMTRLNNSGMRDTLDDLVLNHKIPIFGVCVGMQIMSHRSEEGNMSGLGWIDGDVVHFKSLQIQNTPLPHMGWNDITPVVGDHLFKDIENPRYYFLHSYVIVPKRQVDVLATAHYGRNFVSAVRNGHIVGTQFHPEKSHQWGINLLKNFAKS